MAAQPDTPRNRIRFACIMIFAKARAQGVAEALTISVDEACAPDGGQLLRIECDADPDLHTLVRGRPQDLGIAAAGPNGRIGRVTPASLRPAPPDPTPTHTRGIHG